MRTIVLVSIALAAMSLTSTYADAGAWCASYRRGVSNCSYSSIDQCLATVRGLGGFCAQIVPRQRLRDLLRELECPDSTKRYRRPYLRLRIGLLISALPGIEHPRALATRGVGSQFSYR